jgi:hypothetical protein
MNEYNITLDGARKEEEAEFWTTFCPAGVSGSSGGDKLKVAKCLVI